MSFDPLLFLIHEYRMEWSEKNSMSINSKKFKELVIRKKSCTNVFTSVFGIPQTCQLSVLGLIFQDNCRFDCHVHEKLIKANKCLFILRSLRKEGLFSGGVRSLVFKYCAS